MPLTKIISKLEVAKVGTEVKFFWTKEDFTIDDTIIAQDDTSEDKYRIDAIINGSLGLKSNWKIVFLSEPIQ